MQRLINEEKKKKKERFTKMVENKTLPKFKSPLFPPIEISKASPYVVELEIEEKEENFSCDGNKATEETGFIGEEPGETLQKNKIPQEQEIFNVSVK